MPKRNIKDEKGNTYGYLTVLYRDKEAPKNNGACWVCRCVCGFYVSVNGAMLRNGNTKSCGCKSAEMRKKKRAEKTRHQKNTGRPAEKLKAEHTSRMQVRTLSPEEIAACEQQYQPPMSREQLGETKALRKYHGMYQRIS